MPVGTVVKWLNRKGIGFIAPKEGGDDILVHYSAVHIGEREDTFVTLGEGEEVEYEVSPDPKNENKFIATKVTGPGGAPVAGRQRGKGKGGKGKGKGGKGRKGDKADA